MMAKTIGLPGTKEFHCLLFKGWGTVKASIRPMVIATVRENKMQLQKGGLWV
jgi:hypothetical protein